MAVRAATVVAVVVLIAAAILGFYLYQQLFPLPGQTVNSENWAGYSDDHSQSSASGTIALPPNSDWGGNGAAGLWVGMGGGSRPGASAWPFWQAGAIITCSSGTCSVELFDEGGTQGAPCNGTCPPAWTQAFGAHVGDSITISISGGSSGAIAVITVDENGINTTYNPPPWTVLAGVTSFPSAEWIFESPAGSGGTDVMPTVSPPGVVFSSMADSSGLSDIGLVQMQDNPNGQSVEVSSMSGAGFSAYSYDG